MSARLVGEVRRRPRGSSLGSCDRFAEGAQQPAEVLRADEEGFELHRPATL